MNMFGSDPVPFIILCCVLVALAALVGGWLPLLIRMTHTRIQIAISFVAGMMLGIALLHFIPAATEQLHSLDRTMTWALVGFLIMFFLQRFFHYHTHEIPAGEAAIPPGGGKLPSEEYHLQESTPHDQHGQQGLGPRRAHVHDHSHDAEHAREGHTSRQLSWIGASAGLTLHSFLAGIALAAAISLGSQGPGKWIGLGTALAVILHKPFDAMAISTLMTAANQSRAARYWVIALFALVTPLGIVSFYLGLSHFSEANSAMLGSALAFSAGTFLCISCSDLLPELQFHTHDRLGLSVALLGGLAVAFAILFAEGAGATHDHGGHGRLNGLPYTQLTAGGPARAATQSRGFQPTLTFLPATRPAE